MPRGSGAGIIFGNTGGVMEAAIRSAYYFLTKKQPQEDLLQLQAVRGLEGVKTAELTIQELPLKVAVVHGTDHARKFLHHIKESGEHFDFVEVMTCPGGTTVAGLLAMEEAGLMTAVVKGVDATIAKDRHG